MVLGPRAPPLASGSLWLPLSRESRYHFFAAAMLFNSAQFIFVFLPIVLSVCLLFCGNPPRADARGDVSGWRLSRILRLRRPLSPPTADSRVDRLQFLRR